MEGVAAAVSAHLGAEAARLDALRAGAAGEAEFAAGAVELAAASADVRGALRAAMDQIASVQFAPHEHGCMCCGPFREREMGNLCFRRGNYVTPGGDSAVKHYTEALAQLPTEAASTGQEECRILLVRRAPAPAPAAGTPSGPGPPRGKPPPLGVPAESVPGAREGERGEGAGRGGAEGAPAEARAPGRVPGDAVRPGPCAAVQGLLPSGEGRPGQGRLG